MLHYLSCKYVEVIVITASMVQMRQLLFIPYLCLIFMSFWHTPHYNYLVFIHGQVTFWSTPFLLCMAEGDTLPKLMGGKHMISTFMSAGKDVPILLSQSNNSTYALCNCGNQVFVLKQQFTLCSVHACACPLENPRPIARTLLVHIIHSVTVNYDLAWVLCHGWAQPQYFF